MKLTKQKKTKSKPTGSKLTSAAKSNKVKSGAGSLAWMMSDPDVIQQRHKEQEEMRKLSFKPRAPEVIFPTGVKKIIRFRSSKPAFAIERYTVKRGKFFDEFTAPQSGKRDLFAESGKSSMLRTFYDVIDIEGYTDKQGKKHKMIPCLLKANQTLYGIFEELRKTLGKLVGRDFAITRTGSGKATAYVAVPLDVSVRDMSKYPLISERAAEFYTPPTLEEQKLILSHESTHGDDDE